MSGTNELELLLRESGRRLADHQVGRFWKFPEEATNTPCDFMGFTSIGRAILIEAKQVERTSLPLGKKPGLTVLQWNSLNEANRAGALSLICWARGDLCATIDMDIALHLSSGRLSIPWEKIDPRYMNSLCGQSAALTILEPWLGIEKKPQQHH